MTPDARAAGRLCARRARAAHAAGADGRQCRPGAARARTDAQLPQATVELVHSRGPLAGRAVAGGGDRMGDGADRDRACPKASPIRAIYEALEGLLDAIEAAPSASGWGAALVRFELLLLAELGFGLDLDRCAVSGVERRPGRGQPQIGPRGQRRRGRALCRQAAAAARLRPRRRAARPGRRSRRASSSPAISSSATS